MSSASTQRAFAPSLHELRAARVLVTTVESGSAVAIIRSLGGRGYHVIAGDTSLHSPGMHSRYTAERLVHPSPRSAPDAFVERVSEAVHRHGIDLVIPVFDAALQPLAAARKQFEGVCRLAVPDSVALRIVTNKRETLELAARVGVPIPKTRLVHTVTEALACAGGLGWPVVLKPQASLVYDGDGSGSFVTVSYAETPEQIAEQMAPLEGRCPVLLQQYCPGAGTGVELLAHKGRILAAFQHRRLRELPFTGGVSSFRESVPLDPVMYGYAERILGALAWTGLAMVEFKLTASGPVLMEVNGRVWGSLPLAVRSGMDFPARLAQLYLSGPPLDPMPATTYRVGVRVRNLRLDLRWLWEALRGADGKSFHRVPTRRDALIGLLGLLDPRSKCDLETIADPGPGWVEMRQLAARTVREALGSLPRVGPLSVPR
jgi:predicted ATP-grasp superfamily ATP-dependent carboligase